jgi:formylglycine-generating enzyme required for sulfatase activity
MTKQLNPGDKAADGSIYVGISPDTKKPFYAAAEDAPLSLSFNKASEYASRKGKEWRLPSPAELEMMFNVRAAIGNFNQTETDGYNRYWSSKNHEEYPELTHARRFTDGATGWVMSDSSVRCVRG